MRWVFFLSVVLKGIGAVLEVLLQMLLTRTIGVAGYGEYAAWVNAADLIYWMLFSALTKCNTFYLSAPAVSLRQFRKKYYGRYVLPVLIGLGAAAWACRLGSAAVLAVGIAGMELLALDRSSTMMAQGQPRPALFGEYVLGRLILIAGVLWLYRAGRLSTLPLLALYAVQYGVILAVFFRSREKSPGTDVSSALSLRKWAVYQRGDLVQALISQMPVLLQYVLGGAFSAGVVSIVLTVKKLVNFISGPTAKVFLPEFSRLHREGQPEEIKRCYASIMRVQMLFAGTLAVVLMGYSGAVLRILAQELLPYAGLFTACAAVFLVIASLGPCSGFLQMTGGERQDNACREFALLAMFAVMLAARHSELTVLYGLCAQALLEGLGKYGCVCRRMGGAPVALPVYLGWWSVPVLMIAAARWFGVQDSPLWMLLAAALTFAAGTLQEFCAGEGKKQDG